MTTILSKEKAASTFTLSITSSCLVIPTTTTTIFIKITLIENALNSNTKRPMFATFSDNCTFDVYYSELKEKGRRMTDK